jgi:uncharacterized protein YndB with AHSA1/START domain
MKEFHGQASALVDARPRVVFDLITDVGRLPEWNRAIEAIVECPQNLSEGAQWKVKMHPPHVPSWGSVSQVEEIDRSHLRFAYETRNADGNPSYTKWAWKVVEKANGAEVSVSWDVYLKTLDRRILAGPLRKRQLRREVQDSLTAMSQNAVTAAS